MFPELLAHPCALTNMRGLFDHVIADQVMGYVICFARNLHTYMRNQLQRRYEPEGGESARVSSLTGPSTVNAMDRATIYLPQPPWGSSAWARSGVTSRGGAGIWDVGAWRRPVSRTRRGRRTAFNPSMGIDRLPELLAWSDFAVIAAPQTPETTGLFHAGTLAHLRPSSYLINIGRGAIVVLDDLVSALRDRLAGAALDVFEIEPLPSDHPLWDFPNVILTPHTAGYSPVIAERHLATLVENVGRFCAENRCSTSCIKLCGFEPRSDVPGS